MKKVIVLLLSILAMSFVYKNKEDKKKPTSLTGTYGVCGCQDEESQNENIELTLNEDGSFVFHKSNLNEKKEIKGSWELKNTSIKLNYSSDDKIHDKWTIDKDYPCIKSTKGLNNTRLCHLEKCKQ